ncbi:hypothetical protein QQS45_08420 [Alteriqipengyuania flavescens]|uniref:capsid assembly protein n=1 Tax=Alteriqipengyuania flavescens TaxID=3053610 RepID=UPI0025B5557F|nr:hypothetical protein [Alteriqipengyuania flavescens]WJY17671.1 hypothetical protein QQW98_08415 [Alteriqipengyuania flavescens]WJY23614.1 hypothetical protein QQS45_08420 [Alteriqipengyuania flavescens]
MAEENQQAEEQQQEQQFTAEEQAAIEKGQAGLSEQQPAAPAPAAGERPDYIPEKFWKDGKADLEGLAKSYAELEKRNSAAPAEGKQQAGDEKSAPARLDGKIEAPKEGEEAAAETPAMAAAMEAASAEWAESGELSEDTFASLEKAGIPRSILDLYLEGVKAQTERDVASIHEIAGGKDAYEAATTWAAKALKAEEIEAFNAALENPAGREGAILGLMQRHARANPSEGKLVQPTDSSAGGDVFASRDELVAAQKDPRYQTDPAYRKEVAEKLARSQKAGFQAFAQPMFGRQVLSS